MQFHRSKLVVDRSDHAITKIPCSKNFRLIVAGSFERWRTFGLHRVNHTISLREGYAKRDRAQNPDESIITAELLQGYAAGMTYNGVISYNIVQRH